jgi:hypothetical protein
MLNMQAVAKTHAKLQDGTPEARRCSLPALPGGCRAPAAMAPNCLAYLV